jgi:DNA-binding CsgD family transcriptional regulator
MGDPVALIEREAILAQLARLADDAGHGRGRIAVVSGTVASGKSALLDAFTGQAADAGVLTLTAVASAAESGLPFGVIGQLLHCAGLSAAERDRIAGLTAGPFPGAPDAQAVQAALCGALLGLSVERPVAIVVDDVHNADPESLGCLAYLMRRLRHARIVAAFGHSDQEPHRHTDFRLDLLRQPNCQSFQLPLLSVDGVARLVTERLATERLAAGDAARIAADCHAYSGGNPLLVHALIDDHQAALCADPGRRLPDLAVAEGYGQAVLSCLRRSGPRMIAVAQGLAVLGAPESVDRLLAEDAGSVAQTLHSLGASGLLHAGRFRHDGAAAAVLMDMDAGLRTDLQRRAAELSHESGAPVEVTAGHLLSGRHTGPAWAVPVLEEASSLALADGRVRAAVEYLKLACGACTDEPRRARIMTTLVRAEWRINPSAPTLHLSALTEAMHRGHLSGSDALILAKALLWHGRYDGATEVLTKLGDAGAFADPATDAELRATLSWMRASYAAFADMVPRPDTQPTIGRMPSMSLGWRLESLTALDSVLTKGPTESVVAEAERILRSSRLDEMGMDTVESALLALTYGECASRAAPWCDGLIDQAIAREAPGRHARLATIRAEISLRQGDLPGAERHARQALSIIPASSWGVVVGASLGSLLMALTGMGMKDEALRELNQPVPEGMLQSRYGLHYLQAKGRCNLSVGHLESALADFRVCGELMRRWDLDMPGLISWRTEAAEVLLLMGERDQARKLMEDQLGRCGSAYPRAYGAALRVLAGTYDLRQRPGVLRRAADVLQGSGDRYELARTLTDLTEAYRALGELRRARMIGRLAWTLAQECGAEPLSRALALDHEQVGADALLDPDAPGAPVILSDAEQRVAELAAQGYTNREISKRLYITVSTVEQHLTRVYRKLKLNRRTDLPSALAAVSAAA